MRSAGNPAQGGSLEEVGPALHVPGKKNTPFTLLATLQSQGTTIRPESSEPHNGPIHGPGPSVPAALALGYSCMPILN